jgi:endonuclease VIII
MPEGDTIFRAARTLNRALAGHQVVRFESVLPALTRVHEDTPITGRTIESVTAAGKHVLMRFSGDLTLRTHMRMNGSWHIYRPGERWRRPRRDMRVLIATSGFEAVGFNVPVAEFLEDQGIARQEDLRLMGPDRLGETFDEDEAIRRFRARGATDIADALLNQRVVAGAGNVYKSEVLFLCKVDPFTAVRLVSDERLRQVLATARKYLRANVIDHTASIVTYTGYRRTTGRVDPSERLYVYGRGGKPCRKCGTFICAKAQGPDARLTYWCPSCQA